MSLDASFVRQKLEFDANLVQVGFVIDKLHRDKFLSHSLAQAIFKLHLFPYEYPNISQT
jgi:phosphatidylinositol kinase/protein kinase (PI-3  family)